MRCGVGRRCSSDPALPWLWLWHRLAATALIRLLSLGTSICCGCGPKKTKNKRTNKKHSFDFHSVLTTLEIQDRDTKNIHLGIISAYCMNVGLKTAPGKHREVSSLEKITLQNPVDLTNVFCFCKYPRIKI